MKAVYTDPYDLTAHELLAEIYEKAGNQGAGAGEAGDPGADEVDRRPEGAGGRGVSRN